MITKFLRSENTFSVNQGLHDIYNYFVAECKPIVGRDSQWASLSLSSLSLSLMLAQWSAQPQLLPHSGHRKLTWGTTSWRNPARIGPRIGPTTITTTTAATTAETEIETERRGRGLWIHLLVDNHPALLVSYVCTNTGVHCEFSSPVCYMFQPAKAEDFIDISSVKNL